MDRSPAVSPSRWLGDLLHTPGGAQRLRPADDYRDTMYVPASVSTERIARGDFYEDCHYHPMLCLSAEGDRLVGVSLVSGGVGVCSEHDCAAVPMTSEEAIDRRLHWDEIAADLQDRPEAIHWDRIEAL